MKHFITTLTLLFKPTIVQYLLHLQYVALRYDSVLIPCNYLKKAGWFSFLGHSETV